MTSPVSGKTTDADVGQLTGITLMDAVMAPLAVEPPGERIRGNVRMVSIRPVLQMGHRQGLIPVSRSKRSIVVSACTVLPFGSDFSTSRFPKTSMSGFSSGTNLSARLRLRVWL